MNKMGMAHINHREDSFYLLNQCSLPWHSAWIISPDTSCNPNITCHLIKTLGIHYKTMSKKNAYHQTKDLYNNLLPVLWYRAHILRIKARKWLRRKIEWYMHRSRLKCFREEHPIPLKIAIIVALSILLDLPYQVITICQPSNQRLNWKTRIFFRLLK